MRRSWRVTTTRTLKPIGVYVQLNYENALKTEHYENETWACYWVYNS